MKQHYLNSELNYIIFKLNCKFPTCRKQCVNFEFPAAQNTLITDHCSFVYNISPSLSLSLSPPHIGVCVHMDACTHMD
jgi:hypothetical protein